MPVAETTTYLADIVKVLQTHWPENRAVNIVCHGHSVPAGYFATPMVDSLNAYPHLLYQGLKHRFPFAVVNVIVTAIGGENAISGAERFAADVLCHQPDVITIDYALNDRRTGLEKACSAWSAMVQSGVAYGARVLLMTPTPDTTQSEAYAGDDKAELDQHAGQIRKLAAEHEVGLVDSLDACLNHSSCGDLSDILAWSNHPNRAGHEIVARELLRWFPAG